MGDRTFVSRARGGLTLFAVVALLVSQVFATQAAAQDASPAAGLGVEFTGGVVPTTFGDIEIPENPQKIVTLTDGALDAVIALGITPAGATRSSNGVGPAEYLADQVPAEVTMVGGWSELDIELIISLEPDLILSDRYQDPETFPTLSEIAPVIAPLEIEVADRDALQQWEYEQLVWGQALGKYDESLALIEDVRARGAGIAAAAGDQAGASVVVFRPQPDFPVIMSQHWITGTVLYWSGFVGNEFTEALAPPHSGRDVSLEQLDVLEADWLFAAARDQEMVDALAIYEENPLFQPITAVQEDQLVLVSGDLWSGATGVLAAHAMMDDIEAIIINGGEATPAS